MYSVEEAEDLTADMLLTGLVVVHDALVGGQDNNTELTGRKDSSAEVLELVEGQIEAGGDNTTLVEAAVQVDDDLARAGIIDDLELIDVAVSLHHTEELDEHLGGGAEDHLFNRVKVRLKHSMYSEKQRCSVADFTRLHTNRSPSSVSSGSPNHHHLHCLGISQSHH